MRSFIQLYIANIREFVRDTSALFWMIAFPVMFILIFGVIFSSEDDVSFSIGLVNEDGEASARLVEGFEAIEAFDLHTGEREEELAELEDGDRSAVIVIPEGTGRAIGEYFDQLSSTSQQAALTQAPLEVYYDPSNQTRSQIVLNIIDQIIAEMNEGMTGIRPALAIEPRTVTADNLRSIDYLLPGILLMAIASGIAYTAVRLFYDVQKGIFERFRSMPIARSAALWGHVLTSLVSNAISVAVIILVALIMGFRSSAGILPWLAVAGILALFTLALTWIAVIPGLTAKSIDGASAFSYPLIFLPFISSAFVPTDGMPGPVRWFAEHQPVTPIVNTLRSLFTEQPVGRDGWLTVAWCVVLLAVAYVLATRIYARRLTQ